MGKSKRERRNLRRQKALPYQVPQGLAMAVDEFAPKDGKNPFIKFVLGVCLPAAVKRTSTLRWSYC